MTHLQDCPLSQPCWDEKVDHAAVGGDGKCCQRCDLICICERLRTFGQRIKEAVAAGIAADTHRMPEDYHVQTIAVPRVTRVVLAAIDRVIEAQR